MHRQITLPPSFQCSLLLPRCTMHRRPTEILCVTRFRHPSAPRRARTLPTRIPPLAISPEPSKWNGRNSAIPLISRQLKDVPILTLEPMVGRYGRRFTQSRRPFSRGPDLCHTHGLHPAVRPDHDQGKLHPLRTGPGDDPHGGRLGFPSSLQRHALTPLDLPTGPRPAEEPAGYRQTQGRRLLDARIRSRVF